MNAGQIALKSMREHPHDAWLRADPTMLVTFSARRAVAGWNEYCVCWFDDGLNQNVCPSGRILFQKDVAVGRGEVPKNHSPPLAPVAPPEATGRAPH